MFKNTLEVLKELENNLKCCICHEIVSDAVRRNGCDNFICRGCSNTDKCDKYECINAAVSHYRQLKDLMLSANSLSNPSELASEYVPKEEYDQNEKNLLPRTRSRELKVPEIHSRYRNKDSKVSNSIHRRNIKGETLLQVAVIKGKTEEVIRLLDMGADPNTKDNAGWTPLHEACSHGLSDITRMLLEHGAAVNALGPDSVSPLHDAVANGSQTIVKLLLCNGADKNLKTVQGKTALDFTKEDDLKQILNSSITELSISPKPKSETKLVLLSTGFNEVHKIQFEKCGKLLNAKLISVFSDDATHLVAVDCGTRQCPRTLKYLKAVLKGIWIVSTDWIDECISKGRPVKEHLFEITGIFQFPDCNGAKRGRENALKKNPGLFSGCNFYFDGKFGLPTPPKNELIQLVQLAGGTVFDVFPSQELDSHKSIPFHMKPGSKLLKYSYFIIYNENGNARAFPQTNRSMGTKALPVAWLLNCIAKFKIEDP